MFKFEEQLILPLYFAGEKMKIFRGIVMSPSCAQRKGFHRKIWGERESAHERRKAG